MYLNSINGLNKAIQGTQYYKSKRPSAKGVLIDRCNFVIHSIVEGNRHNWNVNDYTEVPLHRNILKAQLGSNEYVTVLKLLQDLDYININNSYLSQYSANKKNKERISNGLMPTIKAESKKYYLTDKAKGYGIKKVGVLSERTEKRILNYKKKLLSTYLKDTQVHGKIFYNLTNLHFDYNNAYKAFKAHTTDNNNIDQAQYYFKTYNALKTINHYTKTSQYIESTDFYYTQSKLVNRVFHYYGNIPKSYRTNLKHKDGNTLAEIDLKNSQPLIITLNYINKLFSTHNINKGIDINKDNRYNKRDIGICVLKSFIDTNTLNLLNNVLSGTFYKTIAEHGLKEGNESFYNLYKNDYSEFKRNILGQGLYFNLLPADSVKDAERYLMELYPEFMEWIRDTKHKNGYKSISIKAQITESCLFINDLFLGLEHGKDFAVPVHDSILVKSNEVDYFLNKLFAIFENRFPMLTPEEVKNLFTITYY